MEMDPLAGHVETVAATGALSSHCGTVFDDVTGPGPPWVRKGKLYIRWIIMAWDP